MCGWYSPYLFRPMILPATLSLLLSGRKSLIERSTCQAHFCIYMPGTGLIYFPHFPHIITTLQVLPHFTEIWNSFLIYSYITDNFTATPHIWLIFTILSFLQILCVDVFLKSCTSDATTGKNPANTGQEVAWVLQTTMYVGGELFLCNWCVPAILTPLWMWVL